MAVEASAQSYAPIRSRSTILYNANGDASGAIRYGRSRWHGGPRNQILYGSGGRLAGAIRYGPSSILHYDADGKVVASVRLRRSDVMFGNGGRPGDPGFDTAGTFGGPEIDCRFSDCFPRGGAPIRAPRGALLPGLPSQLDFGRFAGGVGRF